MLKLPSYLDILKIRAAESKIAYSVRHDWETFYGNSEQTSDQWEKPDTVHLNDMPIKCFAARGGDSSKPSEAVLREVFSIFGEIKMIDIPMLSSPSFSSSSSKPETFEAFIQYKDYFSFVKAMDTFRGMKLLYADQTEAYTANIRVLGYFVYAFWTYSYFLFYFMAKFITFITIILGFLLYYIMYRNYFFTIVKLDEFNFVTIWFKLWRYYKQIVVLLCDLYMELV